MLREVIVNGMDIREANEIEWLGANYLVDNMLNVDMGMGCICGDVWNCNDREYMSCEDVEYIINRIYFEKNRFNGIVIEAYKECDVDEENVKYFILEV